MLTNAEELIGDVKIGGSPGCSDHSLVEFSILNIVKSRVKTLNLRKVKICLFRALGHSIPLKMCFRDKRTNETYLKTFFSLRAQKLSIPTCKKWEEEAEDQFG